MQTREQLLSAFDRACTWNAFLYTTYKACATGLTFFLCATLQSTYFCLYANITSIIFLILLWADCGFKKSIARFLPEYEAHGISFKTIMHKLLLTRLLVLICALPACLYMIQTSCTFLVSIDATRLLAISSWIFCAEGILLFLQLMYHAHFLNGYFNSMNTIGLLLHSLCAFILSLSSSSQDEIITWILVSKAIISTITALVAYIMIIYLQPSYNIQQDNKLNLSETATLDKQFALHSAYMWAGITIKSITERNALMPILTYFLGPAQANIFKVANEGALFFYRIALKTIGTNDTVIFTHARLYKKNIIAVFSHVQQKIAMLCAFACILFMPIFINQWHTNAQSIGMSLFFINTLCYLLEVFLSPYERILEVERSYRMLMIAHIPYVMLIIALISTSIITTLGLFSTITLINAVRIICAVSLMFGAKKGLLRRTKATALPV